MAFLKERLEFVNFKYPFCPVLSGVQIGDEWEDTIDLFFLCDGISSDTEGDRVNFPPGHLARLILFRAASVSSEILVFTEFVDFKSDEIDAMMLFEDRLDF